MTPLELALKLGPYIAWSIGMIGVWGWLVLDDLRSAQEPTQRRDNLDDLLPDVVMLCAGILAAVALALIAAGIQDWRGFFVALVFGSFLAAGIVKATMRQRARRRGVVR